MYSGNYQDLEGKLLFYATEAWPAEVFHNSKDNIDSNKQWNESAYKAKRVLSFKAINQTNSFLFAPNPNPSSITWSTYTHMHFFNEVFGQMDCFLHFNLQKNPETKTKI